MASSPPSGFKFPHEVVERAAALKETLQACLNPGYPLFRKQSKRGRQMMSVFYTNGYGASFPYSVPGKKPVCPRVEDTPVVLADNRTLWDEENGLYSLGSVPGGEGIPDGVNIVGVDPGIVNLLTNDSGVKVTREEYYGRTKKKAGRLAKAKKKPGLERVVAAEKTP